MDYYVTVQPYFAAMKKSLLIPSLSYLFLLIILSFTWSSLYFNSESKKGDDIIFCIELIGLVTFIYFIIAKFILQSKFPFWLIFVMPFASCILTIILLVVLNATFSLNDYQSLRVYFYLHAIVTIACVFIIVKIAKQRSETGI